MKRKLALAMVLAMTASMAQPVLAADSKTTLDVIISQYGTQTQAWWSQFEKDFEAENPDVDLNIEIVSWNDLYTKVNTLVANNNAPDILNIDVLADYVADDRLRRLSAQCGHRSHGAAASGSWYSAPVLHPQP